MSTDWIDNDVTLPTDGYSRIARVGIKAARTAMFVYSSLLHHRRCFRDIWYGQIIALSLFTLWRRRIAVRGGVVMRKSAKHSLFSALHGMPARTSDEKAVCLSVCLSNAWIVIKRKKDLSRFLYHTKKNIFPSFLRRMVGGGDPFYVKFWVN